MGEEREGRKASKCHSWTRRFYSIVFHYQQTLRQKFHFLSVLLKKQFRVRAMCPLDTWMEWDRETYFKWQVLILLAISLVLIYGPAVVYPTLCWAPRTQRWVSQVLNAGSLMVQWYQWDFWKILSNLGQCGRGTFSEQCFQINRLFPRTTYLLSEGHLWAVCCWQPQPWAESLPEGHRTHSSRKNCWFYKTTSLCLFSPENPHDVLNQYTGKKVATYDFSNVKKHWSFLCVFHIFNVPPE